MKSEFEKLPDIAKNIDKYIYCEIENKYEVLDARYALGRIRINGAWYAYQQQQSKIDELQKRVDDLTQVMEKLLEEMKYPTATFEEVICSGVRELEQVLKGESND